MLGIILNDRDSDNFRIVVILTETFEFQTNLYKNIKYFIWQ